MYCAEDRTWLMDVVLAFLCETNGPKADRLLTFNGGGA